MKKVLLAVIITSSFAHADVEKDFYRNGQIKSEITYDVNAKANCFVKRYYRDGKVKHEILYNAKSKSECNFIK